MDSMLLDQNRPPQTGLAVQRPAASYLAEKGTFDKCLLLFSGGLDTSCMTKWIAERYECDVYTFTLDVGQDEDFAALERKAYAIGAKRHFCVDAREELVEDFCWKAVKANAMTGRNGHPLSSSLTRPLMIKHALEIAAREGIPVLAHGGTGRSNDSLRVDTGVLTLSPEMRVLAPVRDWGLTREAELEYVRAHGIEVSATPSRSYSIDDNLWARETEAGLLNYTDEPAPDEIFSRVRAPELAPDEPAAVTVDFAEGVPAGLDGESMPALQIVETLNEIGAEHGIGRFDVLEDRGVGIKVRELHEAPAAEILIRAHVDLQELVLTKEELRVSRLVELEWVEQALTGFWYTPLMSALNAFFDESQKRLTGSVTLRLGKGKASVVTRTSPYALDLTNLGVVTRLNEGATSAFIEVAGLQRRASQMMAARAARDGR